MMSSERGTSAKNNIRFPFTPTQYHELEHQALIFRYIASGMPIPLHLIPTIKPNLDPFLHLHQPQHIGWDYFQMGYGRKIDPEPGRCRRTDGKKWRCSKEAYTDSKYCERHMHRGRNRSRKPVENNDNKSPQNISFSISMPGSKSPQNPSKPTSISSKNSTTPHHIGPFLYPHSTTSVFGLESGLHLHNQNHKDYSSYFHGIKEEVSEQDLFSSNSDGTMIRSISGSSVGDNSWHIDQPQPTNKHTNFSALQSEYSYLPPTSREKQQDDNEWGQMMKMEINNEPQTVMHHFFDEWPKHKDPWEESNNGQASDIQLSISMPRSSHHDFFSRSHNGILHDQSYTKSESFLNCGIQITDQKVLAL